MNGRMRQWFKRFPLLAVGTALVLGGSAVAFTVKSASKDDSANAQAPQVKLVVDNQPLPRNGKTFTSFAPVVKKVAPSVVSVYITINAKQTSLRNAPLFDNPFFHQFFGNQFGQGGQRLYTPPQRGIGSGVIVSKDGYILTNNHVVENADEVKVALQDGREFTAKVIGRDPKSDVAVIKVDAKDLPNIEMADSDQIEVGDVVLAIGNPFGIGQTVTMGIVSATGRATLGLDYEDFIQTDAAINPGNSGGALVDAEGRLIGINTAILSRSGGNQGIGFAIPTDLARGVMTSLINYGKVSRGYLGVMIQNLTPTLAKEFKLKNDHGALVGDVVPDSPAAKAGIKSGDVVLEYNGKPVTDSRHLKLEVASTQPDKTVSVKLWRDGSTKTLDVTLQQLPGSEQVAQAGKSGTNPDEHLQGVTVGDLNSQLRQELGVPDHLEGAVVTDVEPGSAAADAGLKAGDVIVEINRHKVKDAEQAVQLTEKQKDPTTLLRVWSKNGSHYLVVDEHAAG